MGSSEDESDVTVMGSAVLKDLIKKRGVAKGKLTLFKKFLARVRPDSLTAEHLIDIELRCSRMSSVFKEFEKVQDRIETLDTDLEAHFEERETFEDTYFHCVSLCKSYLRQVARSNESGAPSANAREVNETREHDSIKYPDISLPSFNGDLTNWIEFRDTFDALVNQTNLKPIQKFKYLKSCLSNSALEVVSSLEYAEESHSIAWQLLCERYNSPKTLVYSHLRALLYIDNVPSTATALRSLNDNISKHVRILKGLNIPTEGWDLLIVFLLSSKLDKPLQNKWEEKNNARELPTLQDFKQFLRSQADLKEAVSHNEPARFEHRELPPRKAMVTTCPPTQINSKVTSKVNTYRNQCPNCKETHYINQCPKFLALNAATRIRVVKRLGLCFNCLASNHILPNCRASNCRTCKGKHHTLLHMTQNDTTESNPRQSTLYSMTEPTTSVESQSINLITNQRQSNSLGQYEGNSLALTQNKVIILSTAQVKVLDNDNQPVMLRALLDSGSQSNFLTENAYRKLNIPKQNVELEVLGFNEKVTKLNQLCNLTIQSKDDSFSTNLSCFIVPNICNLPTHTPKVKYFNIPQRFNLADELFYQGGDIDLILGAEQFYQLLCIGQYRLGDGLPILQRTRLGWVVSGAYIANAPKKVRCNLIQTKALQTFWNSEECSRSTKVPHDDYMECEKIFNEHKRTSDGNFVVNIPLKESVTCLGHSRSIVYKRFKTLESKFARDPVYKNQYVQFMREFEKAGHMVQATNTDHCNLLPHHAILTPQKLTTPLRVVVDASFQTNTGKSLNDIQYKGTINQDDLVNILLRFRKNRYVVNADIEKMYRRIYINPNQRNLQCILWRENPNEPLHTYTLTTLSFGLKCAPYVATRCLQQLAQENQEQFPQAAQAITNSMYMDDLLHGGDDEQQVAETAANIDRILRGANFVLRKWKTNSPNILRNISTKPEHTNTFQSTPPTALGHDTHKVLGLAWCSTSDSLRYQFKDEPVPTPLTKRKILSLASAIFDPLGLLNPTLIIAKQIIQRLWKEKIDWDQTLPIPITNEWELFYKKLFTLNSLVIPRHALGSDYVILQLHGFADSSLTAYGAAIYLRTIDKQGHIITRLLCSKTRIARSETIPKLELRSCLVLAQLYNKVNNALKCTFTKTYFYSDSNVALAWMKSQQPSKLDCFVRNRVVEIQRLTDVNDWHWVITTDNPADLLTRGLPADKLANCNLWWQGPYWLNKRIDDWPSHKTTLPPLPVYCEAIVAHCNVATNVQPNLFMTELFKRWSNLSKLINCVAVMLRFRNNCLNRDNRIIGPFSVDELKTALNKLIQVAQLEVYPIEYHLLQNNKPIPKSSNLLCLNPFMENRMLRVGGRLGRSEYSHDKKHPIILPPKHELSKLIMRDEHVRLLHAGPQLLLSSVRERFWPINGKSLANKILEKCVTCFRAKPKVHVPIMGDLPPARVTPSPPFVFTALDYGGPYMIRDRRGRGYKTDKCYIAIFNCMTTKAVHIELITGLQTSAFLSAFRRFIARRGKPKEMLTDNASTFQGACNELTELCNFLNNSSNDMTTFFSHEGIQWKFLPPYTPHMGGLHESSIKRCKFHLKRVIGQALLTYEEFTTVLVQIEGILNSRPLCPIPNSNTDEITYLSPAHFLINRTPSTLPDYDYQDVPLNRLTHYQQLQQLQQGFWRRWS